ncbi:MAG: isochorismatase family protein [Ancrocorticia sp.]
MEETTRALIIVDVQPTFCEGGSLAVEGGNAVAEKIADFVQDNLDEYALIVTTQDWHINPGSHFSSTPDFVDTWPPHGVAGTPEAELHEAIASLPIDVEVKKGEYAAAYSGFEGVDGQDRSLEDVLREAEIEAIDVVGIAESHCVKETALDGLRAGWPVRVLSDLTVPVSEELGEEARQEMDEAGIEQINSGEAFGFYEEGEDAEIPGDTASLADSEGGLDDSEYGSDSYDAYDSDGYGDSDSYDGYDSDGGSDSYDAYGSYDDEDNYDDDAGANNETDDDFEENFDLGNFITAGISSMSQRTGTASADEDIDLADFDDFDLDDEGFDFSGDASDDDFDFSDIDFKPGK